MPDRIPNIYLVGPMGAGKSAVGRRLAGLLKLGFADSDDEIERRTGVDIAFIFEKEGEAGFRRRERAVVEDLTALDGMVVATGGGVIGDPENRRLLRANGTVVYLTASTEQQVERTRRGRERPMLNGGDPREILEGLMAVRDPLYREVADFVVATDGRKVAAVADEIRRRVTAADPDAAVVPAD